MALAAVTARPRIASRVAAVTTRPAPATANHAVVDTVRRAATRVVAVVDTARHEAIRAGAVAVATGARTAATVVEGAGTNTIFASSRGLEILGAVP